MTIGIEHVHRLISIEEEDIRNKKEQWEMAHEAVNAVRAIEASVKRMTTIHDMALDLDADVHGSVAQFEKEEWLKIEAKLSDLLDYVLQVEEDTIQVCEWIEKKDYKVEGLQALKQMFSDLKKNMASEWEYDSPGFQKILKKSKEDEKAGRVSEF